MNKNNMLSNKYDISPYDASIDCYKHLMQLQKYIKISNVEHVNVSLIERKSHENPYNLDFLTEEYKNLYNFCEKYIKP